MSVVDCATRVRSDDASGLTAQCLACRCEFVLLSGQDVRAGLAAFDSCHPGRADAPHHRRTPTGWRRTGQRPARATASDRRGAEAPVDRSAR